MKYKNLIEILKNYTPYDYTESVLKNKILDFVSENKDCMNRNLKIGHITASAWIVDEKLEYALLVNHRSLKKWLQLGGHAEGEEFIQDVAIREAYEESGLKLDNSYCEDIFSIDIHTIPLKRECPEHSHYDIRFLFFADRSENITISPESKDFKWMLLEDIILFNSDESMKRLVNKTIELRNNTIKFEMN